MSTGDNKGRDTAPVYLIVIFILLGLILLAGAFRSETKNNYEQGFSDGYESGYSEGKRDGYDEGYKEGNIKGYEDGRENGYEAGRKFEQALNDFNS